MKVAYFSLFFPVVHEFCRRNWNSIKWECCRIIFLFAEVIISRAIMFAWSLVWSLQITTSQTHFEQTFNGYCICKTINDEMIHTYVRHCFATNIALAFWTIILPTIDTDVFRLSSSCFLFKLFSVLFIFILNSDCYMSR